MNPKKNILKEIDELFEALFPINRSLTGQGNRDTLSIIKDYVPLRILEIPSGKTVYDWTIPNEWNVSEAWIKNASGKKIVDFKKNNLHLVSYSSYIHKKLEFKKLKKNLHYLNESPNTIPYRTTYYNENWGFCLSKNEFLMMEKEKGPFEVFINSEFNNNGSLSIGEILIPGFSKKEILISTYICHPSLANDNLSGIILTAFLARYIRQIKERYYSYRIVWLPETIGAIAYCSHREKELKKIDIGFVITTVAGPGKIGFKNSFEKNNPINKIVRDILKSNIKDFVEYPFDINGSDERQFSAKGFRINTVSITKSKYYEYKEYHTSDDNLDFISSNSLYQTLDLYIKAIKKLETRIIFDNISPNCETMLSKYNLYPVFGGAQNPNFEYKTRLDKILWILFKSNGKLSTQDIAEETNIDNNEIIEISEFLEKKKILKRI